MLSLAVHILLQKKIEWGRLSTGCKLRLVAEVYHDKGGTVSAFQTHPPLSLALTIYLTRSLQKMHTVRDKYFEQGED